jgi:glycosyltransferase involved in cell wall biosynthesis
MRRLRKTHRVAVIQRTIPHYRRDFFVKVADHRPDVVVLHSTRKTADGLVQETRFPFPNIHFPMIEWRFFCYQGLLGHLLRADYDTIVLGPELRIVSNLLVWVLAAIKPIKIISWTHGYDVHKKENDRWFKTDRLFKTLLLKQSKMVMLYTTYNLPELIYRGIEPGRIVILNNTINAAPYLAASNRVTDARLRDVEKKTRASTHCLTFIGRLTRAKRPGIVLELAAQLRQRYSDLRVFFIGDGPERDALERRALCMGLDVAVFFLGTITDPDDLSPYMRLTDFVVLPGAVGLSLVHSNIYGIPFITFKDAAHSPEIAYLQNDCNGYAADDLNDMVRWIIDAFEKPGKLEKMQRYCTRLISKQLNMDAMVDRFISGLDR